MEIYELILIEDIIYTIKKDSMFFSMKEPINTP